MRPSARVTASGVVCTPVQVLPLSHRRWTWLRPTGKVGALAPTSGCCRSGRRQQGSRECRAGVQPTVAVSANCKGLRARLLVQQDTLCCLKVGRELGRGILCPTHLFPRPVSLRQLRLLPSFNSWARCYRLAGRSTRWRGLRCSSGTRPPGSMRSGQTTTCSAPRSMRPTPAAAA